MKADLYKVLSSNQKTALAVAGWNDKVWPEVEVISHANDVALLGRNKEGRHLKLSFHSGFLTSVETIKFAKAAAVSNLEAHLKPLFSTYGITDTSGLMVKTTQLTDTGGYAMPPSVVSVELTAKGSNGKTISLNGIVVKESGQIWKWQATQS